MTLLQLWAVCILAARLTIILTQWLNHQSAAVVPNGLATGLDIGLSNYSLSLITLSFYTMCKSTTPIFLLGFCFLWGLERCSAHMLPYYWHGDRPACLPACTLPGMVSPRDAAWQPTALQGSQDEPSC